MMIKSINLPYILHWIIFLPFFRSAFFPTQPVLLKMPPPHSKSKETFDPIPTTWISLLHFRCWKHRWEHLKLAEIGVIVCWLEHALFTFVLQAFLRARTFFTLQSDQKWSDWEFLRQWHHKDELKLIFALINSFSSGFTSWSAYCE